MGEIEFLSWEELEALHRLQLELFGGQEGFTDRATVESAFARARWAATYGDPDIADLAAEYLYGLATTQGFSDGNKRTATHTALIFLAKNGYRIAASEEELYDAVMAVATGKMERADTAAWIRAHLAPRV